MFTKTGTGIGPGVLHQTQTSSSAHTRLRDGLQHQSNAGVLRMSSEEVLQSTGGLGWDILTLPNALTQHPGRKAKHHLGLKGAGEKEQRLGGGREEEQNRGVRKKNSVRERDRQKEKDREN